MGFFDDLGKKASETYKNTAEKTNKITREMKLKSLINEDKSKIEKLYNEIGKKVYENRLIEDESLKQSIVEECEKIDVLAKEVLDMNIEMLALKGIKKCSNCFAEIPVNAKFCSACGSFQEEKEKTIIVGEIVENEKNDEVVDNNCEVKCNEFEGNKELEQYSEEKNCECNE